MHVPAVSLVLLSTLLVFNAEPQLGRYPVPYAPSFRGYFFQPHYPNFRHYAEFPQRVSSNNQPRFIFLESTYVTTTTTTTVYNCRYSTAVLAACRRKRSVEEDAHDIVPSAVASVVSTEEASMDDVRDKRQLRVREYFPYDPYEPDYGYVQSSIGLNQRDGGLVPFEGGARFFFQVTTSTSTLIFTNTQSTLVTCAPLTGFASPQC